MKGPFSDPQHPYMYEEEDMWMAPGFINQFYPVGFSQLLSDPEVENKSKCVSIIIVTKVTILGVTTIWLICSYGFDGRHVFKGYSLVTCRT